jgi:hypothetical protein
MALGTNRDYKTADRRARTQLAKHAKLMEELLADRDFYPFDRHHASNHALAMMEKKPCPFRGCLAPMATESK